MSLPKDALMLLSVVNTKLRDYYDNLQALCEAEDVTEEELENRLSAIDYHYDATRNQFV